MPRWCTLREAKKSEQRSYESAKATLRHLRQQLTNISGIRVLCLGGCLLTNSGPLSLLVRGSLKNVPFRENAPHTSYPPRLMGENITGPMAEEGRQVRRWLPKKSRQGSTRTHEGVPVIAVCWGYSLGCCRSFSPPTPSSSPLLSASLRLLFISSPNTERPGGGM